MAAVASETWILRNTVADQGDAQYPGRSHYALDDPPLEGAEGKLEGQ